MLMLIYTLSSVKQIINSKWEAAVMQRELSLMLCDDLEGGMRARWEGGSRGRRYMYT